MTDSSSSSPVPEILYPEWQPAYRAALLELDPKQLPDRVIAAETAIFSRLQAISGNMDHHAERRAIEDALAGLRVLKREALAYPDWEEEVGSSGDGAAQVAYPFEQGGDMLSLRDKRCHSYSTGLARRKRISIGAEYNHRHVKEAAFSQGGPRLFRSSLALTRPSQSRQAGTPEPCQSHLVHSPPPQKFRTRPQT